jgi:hypothetical protein
MDREKYMAKDMDINVDMNVDMNTDSNRNLNRNRVHVLQVHFCWSRTWPLYMFPLNNF